MYTPMCLWHTAKGTCFTVLMFDPWHMLLQYTLSSRKHGSQSVQLLSHVMGLAKVLSSFDEMLRMMRQVN